MELKPIIQSIEKNNHKVVLFFFIAFLFLGLSGFRDYGVSWDEGFQWKDNGYVNYDFIIHGNSAALLKGKDKYHGPAFELVLIAGEKLMCLTDSRTIFFFRHLMTFLVFYFSAIIFYFLSLRIFKNWRIAFLGALLYVLSPHIFSHAFYNSKDTVFLSFFTISFYCLFCFLEKRTYCNAFVFAIVSAFTIDIRIIGILIPLFFIYLMIIEGIRTKRVKKSGQLLVFILSVIPLIILFWPVLWIDPIFHFTEALKENSHYPWEAPVLYFGEQYTPTTLPWHYLFYWMFISRPVIYSVLLVIGTITLLWQFISKPLNFLLVRTEAQVVLFWFFFPLVLMLIFKSPSFDTGRHMYFMHGGFVLLSLYGIEKLYKEIARWKKGHLLVTGIIGFTLIDVSVKMVRLHPLEHLYMNSFAGKDRQNIKNNFESDYWGLAERDVLEHIVRVDSSPRINIIGENAPAKLNSLILSANDRSRIHYTDNREEGGYYIADYRWKKANDYPYKTEVYSTMIGNAKIATAFKIRKPKELYNSKSKSLLTLQNDFEKPEKYWTRFHVVHPSEGAFSGNTSILTDSLSEYSDGLELTDLDRLTGNKKIFVKTSFRILDRIAGSAWKFVISIETKEGLVYFWQPINETHNTNKNSNHEDWKKVTGAMELPVIRDKDDKIKIYLFNVGKKRILTDDYKISFEEEVN